MKRFAELYATLDATTKTSEKITALSHYFHGAPPADAAWAVWFLCGGKLPRLVPTPLLRRWAAEVAGVGDWLFDECYAAVGDLAETIALIVPPASQSTDRPLRDWIEEQLQPLRGLPADAQRPSVVELWEQTDGVERFVAMKLITGSFRVGVSRGLVIRALAAASGLDKEAIAHRLMGDWQPSPEFYRALLDPHTDDAQLSRPYPFCLAHPLDAEPEVRLADFAGYAAEWKWDGIRGQVVRRGQRTFVWSRGEELMEGRWPEIETVAEALPEGTVIDGEILAVDGDCVLPFAQLQRRIGRKSVGKKLLAEVPVSFVSFDLLEHGGVDVRSLPWSERRSLLEAIVGTVDDPRLRLTELMQASSWDDLRRIRKRSRQANAEGLMLKRRSAAYEVGRVRGVWWKWKIAPYTIDAVLIYAQRGHGRRASLYTDYTFALWDDDGVLVPFAKAYSGLDDAEIRQVDQFVRQHTEQRFGPVRSVSPQLVMELAFEGIQISKRHKSGIAVRFPRISRWRHDKRPADANTLSDLRALIPS